MPAGIWYQAVWPYRYEENHLIRNDPDLQRLLAV